MKKIVSILAMTAAVAALAADIPADAFTLVNDEQGYSYLQINVDMADFGFASDWHSIGNSGSVGVFKYPDGLEGQALKDYIASYDDIDAKFSKHVNGGVVEIGDVKDGDRYGFYLLRKEKQGTVLVKLWDFQYKHDQAYIAFDKNGGGKDEWMSIGKAGGTTSGAPLPGSLAVMLVGGLAAGFRKLRRRA